MLHTAKPVGLLKRDRIFEVSFSDYVNTVNGLFNVPRSGGSDRAVLSLMVSENPRCSAWIQRNSSWRFEQPGTMSAGGFVVFLMMDQTHTRSESLLKATSYAFFYNGLFMLLSSILSATSAYYLPGLFYYVIYEGTGAVLYIFNCLMIVRESHDTGLTPMVGLMTGGMHAFHCAYSTYKNYYE
ncbi:hypothetical protein MRX96_042416 [Rhipicephalus microplus]